VILAGVLLKLGAYGFIRFAIPLFPHGAHVFAPLLIALSVIAIIYGAIVALVQPDLKKLIAYSSVSHMGFVTWDLHLPAAGPPGRDPPDGQPRPDHGRALPPRRCDLRADPRPTLAKMGGLGAVTPVYSAAFGFFVFASVGLPGLAGFVGEFLVFQGAFAYNRGWASRSRS